MLRALRHKLTNSFLILCLLIYGLGGGAFLAVFYSGLTNALDEEITDLSSEILPAIEFRNDRPSLRNWASTATHEHLSFPAGIQLFDHNKQLLESYGLSGRTLLKGEFHILKKGQECTLRSSFKALENAGGQPAGYLQIQMATKARDESIKQFALAMLLILPFLAVTVTMAGYFFSGIAIQPVEKSIKMLKTFVADAGHEFITPVTVVEASIQTLEETLREHGINLDVLNIIVRASSRMKELASDLIILARFDSPTVELTKEDLSISDVVQPAVEEVIEIARSKGVELNYSKIPDLKVNGNLHSLKIMVSNLVGNAVKYTEPGGTVQVAVALEGNRVCLSVEDTGIGIPQANIENIFDRFYRVDQSRSRAAGGSGLGLAIVKAILDYHKADIDVQSSPGKGSKFTVRMPRVV